MTAAIPAPVDPAEEPYLSGPFAPVHHERDDVDLEVQGDLPEGLHGAYVRNGPNALFPPLESYTYPLDGDGMVHGIWFDDGSVRYRNRSVWTPHLKAEVEAGHALWAGIMSMYLPGPDVVPEALANNYKALPDINVVRHAGRYLALAESDVAYELTAELDTVGAFDFGGAIPGMTAHPRIDPVTGELVIFRYDLAEPYLTWSVVAADGTVTTTPQVIDVDRPYMVHDFVITESSAVLFVGPLSFDFDQMFAGGSLLAWRPEDGSKIIVIDRATGAIRQVQTEAFWVWHFANAFDRPNGSGGIEIVVDYVDWTHPGLIVASDVEAQGSAARAIIDPVAGTFRKETFLPEPMDFPRIDDRLTGREHPSFITTCASSPDAGQHDTLLRFDTATGAVERWESGTWEFAEVCFVPTPGGGPDEGCYVTFRTDRTTLESDLVVLAADDIAAGPVARIPLPGRVPHGLHGNWFAGA